jgi:hypothetical protein
MTLTSQFGTQEHPISLLTDHILEGWNRERERENEKRRNINPQKHIRT